MNNTFTDVIFCLPSHTCCHSIRWSPSIIHLSYILYPYPWLVDWEDGRCGFGIKKRNPVSVCYLFVDPKNVLCLYLFSTLLLLLPQISSCILNTTQVCDSTSLHFHFHNPSFNDYCQVEQWSGRNNDYCCPSVFLRSGILTHVSDIERSECLSVSFVMSRKE